MPDEVPGWLNPLSVGNAVSVVVAVAPSGDTSGATDYANINAILAQNKTAYLLPNSLYYTNTTLTLLQYSGLCIPPSATLRWAGAAGGTVVATTPYVGGATPFYEGFLGGGGQISYPDNLLAAGSTGVYIAMPFMHEPVKLYVFMGGAAGAPVANTYGFDLDGCASPGNHILAGCQVRGRCDTSYRMRSWHTILIGCQAAYSNRFMSLEQDSQAGAGGPCNIYVDGFHAYAHQNEAFHLVLGCNLTVVGGMNEGAGLTTPQLVRAESTFTGYASLTDVNDRFVNATPIVSFATAGYIRTRINNNGNTIANIPWGDTLWVGQASGVAIPLNDSNYTPHPDQLSSGEYTLLRDSATSNSYTPASGEETFSYFTATRTETVTQIRVLAGATGATGLTLCRFGLYTAAANGDLTQVAATPNDTTLLATNGAMSGKALSASYTKQAGQRYAVGIIQVGTTPAKLGGAFSTQGTTSPRLHGRITGQADLVNAQTAAGMTSPGYRVYAEVTP